MNAIEIDPKARIALVGDWGTGAQPAISVLRLIARRSRTSSFAWVTFTIRERRRNVGKTFIILLIRSFDETIRNCRYSRFPAITICIAVVSATMN
jgi:hypothetical protein